MVSGLACEFSRTLYEKKMVLVNCSNCNKVFPGKRGSFCPDCMLAEDRAFDAIKVHLLENPEASAEEVAEAIGLDIKVILRLLRAGRLKVKHPEAKLVCKGCGNPIKSGVYCRRCGAAKSPVSDVSIKDGMNKSADALRPIPKTRKGRIHSRRIRKKSGL